MSGDENPYQAPVVADLVDHPHSATGVDGLWRKGNLLVMHRNAPLPERCVKSNAPTNRRLKRTLSWHHPAVFLSIFAGLLIYVVLALVLRKTATIYIGLSEEWFAKRRRAMLVAWTTVLVSVPLFIAGMWGIDRSEAYALLVTAGVFLFLGGAIYGLVCARMVAPTRITATHIWLKGVCPEFLTDLPEWQH